MGFEDEVARRRVEQSRRETSARDAVIAQQRRAAEGPGALVGLVHELADRF